MGEEDIRRQKLNVFKHAGSWAPKSSRSTAARKTLRDAINEAMRDWMASVEHTHYIIGSVVGPHPFPMMVRDFQAVIGRETRQQCLEQIGRLPDVVVACVGGGSNAAGMFYPFIDDNGVELVGVEAGGRGADSPASTPPRSATASPASCTAASATCCRTTTARPPTSTRSPPASTIPASAPSTATGRTPAGCATRASTTPRRWKASASARRLEGILPALETAHAVVEAMRIAASAAEGRRRGRSASPAAATRTVRRWPGWRLERQH